MNNFMEYEQIYPLPKKLNTKNAIQGQRRKTFKID